MSTVVRVNRLQLREWADELAGEEIRKGAKALLTAGIILLAAGHRVQRWINS